MKRSYSLKLSLGIVSFGLAVSSTFAMSYYAITDNASPFGIAIGLDENMRTVTFHVPDFSDDECKDFTTVVKHVEYGASIGSEGVPDTSPQYSFTFQGWYSEATYENEVETTDLVSANTNVYAKFIRTAALYDSSNKEYFLSSSSEQTISSRYIYKVSNHVWGSDPSTSDSNKLDLTTASGKYKCSYATNTWTIKRVVGVGLGDGVTWWTNDSAKFRLWQFNGLDSLGDTWSGLFTFTSNKATVEIDYRYRKIIVARISNENVPTDWSNVWNQTVDVNLAEGDCGTGDNQHYYTSSSARLYVWNDKSGNNYKFGWGAW